MTAEKGYSRRDFVKRVVGVPGDAVEIVVLRDGERLTLTAVLGDRR